MKEQIVTNATQRSNLRTAYLEEGATIRRQMDIQSKKSNYIKEQKLKELSSLGIPEKYRSELAKTKVG